MAAFSLALAWSAAAPLAVAQPAAKPATPAAKPVAPPSDKPAAASTNVAKIGGVQPVVDKAKPKAAPKAKPVPAQAITDFVTWIVSSGDNRGMAFAVVDKNSAEIAVYDAKGKLKSFAPTLLGSAVGDESAPGVGDRELKDIPMEDRTTPAGRFVSGWGPAAGGKVLWIDYQNSISIHAVPPTAPAKEKRFQRLASKTAGDNRITHGCVNVSSAFYSNTVRTTFKKGGVFYILPETLSLGAAFPAYEAAAQLVSAHADETAVSTTAVSDASYAARRTPASEAAR